MKEKIIGIFVCTLLISTVILPVAGTIKENTVSHGIGSRGYIQGLIDNASDGDTISIPSGIYYENIVINKSISLIGEDKNTTIIDGSGSGNVVYIKANWINISNFKIRNGNHGIEIDAHYNTVSSNIISNNQYGIFLGGSNYNNIINNTIISNNKNGIHLGSSYSNKIITNNISFNNDTGIHLYLSSNNTIIGNIISNKNYGIYIGGSNYNNITGNTISKNTFGIYLKFSIVLQHKRSSKKNNITKNNFLGYRQLTYCGGDWSNLWSENYWNRPRIFPKLIFGAVLVGFYGFEGIPVTIPWINIDWHPAKEPYNIEV